MASVSELIERESWMKDEVAVEVKEDVLQQLIDYAYTQMLGPFTRKSEVMSLNTVVGHQGADSKWNETPAPISSTVHSVHVM